MGRGGFTQWRGLFRNLFTPKVSPAPPIEIRENDGIICAFFILLIQTSASSSMAGSRNCLIIIKLTSRQDKTGTKKMRKILFAFALCVSVLLLTSCQKETWDFNYPKDQLCSGYWKATHASLSGGNGYWSTMSSLNESLMLIFHEDGGYYSSGSFNASSSSHSWEAHGNTIDIYSGGTKLYTWTVESWEAGNIIEMKMTAGNSSLYYRFEKR